MKKLILASLPLLLLTACSAPREPSEQWAKPKAESWCDRYAGGASGGGPSSGDLLYYDRQGTPYFAGPHRTFRDPYFVPDDPLKKDAFRECLEEHREAQG